MGLGIANPTEVPHLTRVPSNSADISQLSLLDIDLNIPIDANIDLTIDGHQYIAWSHIVAIRP